MHNGNSVAIEDLVKLFGDFVAVDHISLETRKGELQLRRLEQNGFCHDPR